MFTNLLLFSNNLFEAGHFMAFPILVNPTWKGCLLKGLDLRPCRGQSGNGQEAAGLRLKSVKKAVANTYNYT